MPNARIGIVDSMASLLKQRRQLLAPPRFDAAEDRLPNSLAFNIARIEKLVGALRRVKLGIHAVHANHLVRARPKLTVADRQVAPLFRGRSKVRRQTSTSFARLRRTCCRSPACLSVGG